MAEPITIDPQQLGTQLNQNWERWIDWYKSLPHGFKPSQYRSTVNNYTTNGQRPSVKTMLRIFCETNFEICITDYEHVQTEIS